jgi:hypothetical protein
MLDVKSSFRHGSSSALLKCYGSMFDEKHGVGSMFDEKHGVVWQKHSSA